jgi:antitoxin (DNA-binding transcriptional repressor) of toxin-antitoxin stability system
VADLAEEILGVTRAKTELPSRLKQLQNGLLDRVVLVRQNNPVAVIVTIEQYNRIRQVQEVEELIDDVKTVLEAKNLDDGTRVSLDELKARYGID